MPFLPEFGGGLCFCQTYCTDVSGTGPVQFTDDVIFAEDKKKILQIVVLLKDLDEWKFAASELEGIGENDHLDTGEATIFVPRESVQSLSDYRNWMLSQCRLFRSASADEFAQSNLCYGRPAPRGHREYLMWEIMGEKRYVVLRPDRFVFAACSTASDLKLATRKLGEMF